MRVDDPLWRECFGTDNSQIEKPYAEPKKGTRKPVRRKQAELIEIRPELFREPTDRPDRQPRLFE